MDTIYRVSATDPHVSVAALAKWIKTVSPIEADSLPKALLIARTIVFGESWCPDTALYNSVSKAAPPPTGVEVSVTYVKDSYDIEREEVLAESIKHTALLLRAVNGDTAAALEYCRLEAAGEISHPPGPAFA